MKQKHTWLAAILTLGIVSAADAAITSGLVAYYDFEESGTAGLANKAPSASSYNGTWVSGSFDSGSGPGFTGDSSFDPGDGVSDRSTLLAGNALNIVDATNDFMSVSLGTAQLGKTMTISMWTYLAPGASNGSARFHAFETGDSGVYDLSIGTAGNYSTTGRDDYSVYIGDNNFVGSYTGFAEGEWDHHVLVITESGDDIFGEYYLNGSSQGVTLDTGAAASFDFSTLHFGDSRSGSGERDWDGMIDEVAIYDRAITSDEVNELYNLGLTGQAIPEPSAMALLCLAGLGVMCQRRR
ncbi:PEP-CTERM protein-sorting domain-containing protein [Rubritalea squalenifaciens DSM 18772]|uniref:PEP-CTERM protein-sorting domain-containing protein n=1 Tax=Rubritalea squalenifaciens DSM 18772 TaxID=1123071 RepID=A0A1M6PXZ8_9BACT|nr:LamG-like jellyroll fold domain-containing protein [Rubritalea squalenifaciens]SHK12782.1 PEP-CTERM protein-sorting domain-containing protein [Rubritalea squalenifaciens DSM 18772]